MQRFIFVDKETGKEEILDSENIKSWFVVSCTMAVLQCTLTEEGVIMEERKDLKPVIINI